jgi:predicted transcriptional regulator
VSKVEEQDKRRWDFLVAVFEATDGGSSMKDVALSEIEAKLRITYEQAEDVFDYLRGQGLVEVRGMGGQICLTPKGRAGVENALRQLPPANPVGFRL